MFSFIVEDSGTKVRFFLNTDVLLGINFIVFFNLSVYLGNKHSAEGDNAAR